MEKKNIDPAKKYAGILSMAFLCIRYKETVKCFRIS